MPVDGCLCECICVGIHSIWKVEARGQSLLSLLGAIDPGFMTVCLTAMTLDGQ